MTQRHTIPLPPDFTETGLHIVRSGEAPITRFQVLGERSSGTNFVKRLLGRNSALAPSEALGWKHGFVHMMAVPHDMAVICVVRNAQDWATSMFAKPWHTTSDMQALGFSEFIRAKWDTIIDRPRYFGGLIEDGSIGAPLQHDRDALTGQCFQNLFALRQAKLTSLFSILNRNCTCVFLRMEMAQSAPEGLRDAIIAGLGTHPRGAPFRPIAKRLGSKFKPAIAERPALPTSWTAEDLAFLREHIDPMQEAALGYAYD